MAHELGLHTWYHCCGEFLPIMEDFQEIGVDVLNISQPNVNDMAEVGGDCGAGNASWSRSATRPSRSRARRQEIYAEAQRLHDRLATPQGGFIGYVEEYGVMGMSPENYCACGEAFRLLDKGPAVNRPPRRMSED